MREVIPQALGIYGGIDILINNAGIGVRLVFCYIVIFWVINLLISL